MTTPDRVQRGALDTALRECWAALQEAMELGDTTELHTLLAEEYTLTHLTGSVQSRAEWLADIDADRMRYHRIEEVEIAVRAQGPAPVITVRTMTEATIHGFHTTWPLQLRTSYRPEGAAWIATGTVASTW